MSEQGISKRDFLSPKYWQESAQAAELREFAEIDAKVSHAIEQFLGLKKDEVELFLRPGNHVLGREHVKFIRENKINHVTGEIETDSLLYYLNPNYRIDAGLDVEQESEPQTLSLRDKLRQIFVRMKNPTIGSTRYQYDMHQEILETLFENGFLLSSTDSDVTALYEDREVPAHLISTAAGSLIAVLMGTAALSKLGHKMTRREFLRKVAKGSTLLGAASLASWLGSIGVPIPTPMKRTPIVERGIEKQIAFEELQSNLSDTDPLFGEFTEIFVKRRNEIMALNMWHTLSQTTLRDSEHQNRILSYFGYGHGEVITDFIQGPEYLTQQVEKLAREICTTGLKQMIADRISADPEEFQRVTIVELALVLHKWSKLFANTAVFGKDPQINISTVANAPENARSVFLRVLKETLQDHENKEADSRVKSIELQALFETLLLCIGDVHDLPKFTQTINTSSEVLEQPEQVLRATDVITGYEKKIEIAVNKTVGTVTDLGVEAVVSGVYIFSMYQEELPLELPVGIWKHNGGFVPFKTVIKQIADDRIETYQEIILKNGVKKLVNKRSFSRLNGEDDPRISQLVLEPRIDLEISFGLDSFSQPHYQLTLIAKSKAEVPGVWGDWSAYVAEDDTDEVFGIKVISHNVDHV